MEYIISYTKCEMQRYQCIGTGSLYSRILIIYAIYELLDSSISMIIL